MIVGVFTAIDSILYNKNMFLMAMPVLLILSFVWALFSLKKELKRPHEINSAKKELMKEKVLFKRD